jgi:hypothetical protein
MIKITFKHNPDQSVETNIDFGGASVMEIAIASLQLQSVVEQQIGPEEAAVLFSSLVKGRVEPVKEAPVKPMFGNNKGDA